MNRTIALIALAVTTACSTVKLVQRDGCWVRRTERPGSVKEELGPCQRPEPKWADDRVTRIVQECVSQADWRWQTQALAAWSRGEPVPERAPADVLLKACLDESALSTLAHDAQLQARAEAAKDRLEDARSRLDEVKADRAALAARSDEDRSRMFQAFDRIAGDLGEAAKKPLPPATATATATTSATSDGKLSGSTEGAPPATTVVTSPAAPALSVSPACAAPAEPGTAGTLRAALGRKAARARTLPRCEPAPGGAGVVAEQASAKPAGTPTPPGGAARSGDSGAPAKVDAKP
ncbi:hypothetical protein [Anaeromyxobacter oryzae]|uniref:Lipoprotein n=1 Tax=Anaeromyxobacter oryzae TaxID=2918170 RepID=A0ABM7X0W6_9BACT|nr:hypothetical protein [Anaeromyxobacter oryzae]BDG05441.1 hypothetical protein AMOR_44370 [Anaeromyxobacter oryzae]